MSTRKKTGDLEWLPPWWTPVVIFVIVTVVHRLLFAMMTEVLIPKGSDGSFPDERWPILVALYCVGNTILVLLGLLVAFRARRASARPILRLNAASVAGFTLVCLVTLCVGLWRIPLSQYFVGGWGLSPNEAAPVDLALVAAYICLALLTPVVEELFFRGYALSVFGRRSVVIGILGSAGLFGCYHFDGSFGSVIVPVPFGVVLGYCVVVTGSVYPTVLAHALWNLTGVGLEVWDLDPQPTPAMLAGSLVIGVACALLLRRTGGQRSGDERT